MCKGGFSLLSGLFAVGDDELYVAVDAFLPASLQEFDVSGAEMCRPVFAFGEEQFLLCVAPGHIESAEGEGGGGDAGEDGFVVLLRLVVELEEELQGFLVSSCLGHCFGDESAVGGFVGKELGESLQVLQLVLEPLLLCIAFCEQAQCLDVVGLQDVGALQAGDGFGVTLLVHQYLSFEQEHWG